MKITEKKLRQIIREEKMKLQGAPLQEALEGVAFYEQKVDLLVTAQQHLDEALVALAEAVDLDRASPVGEDPDVQGAYSDVEAASQFIGDIIEATEAMVEMGR
jgi:hypothetical protein